MTTALEMHLRKAGPAQALAAREVTLAAPGPGEALVAIEAAGVAYADLVMRQGLYPGVKAPVTPGYDLVGRIEALGPGVEGFSVGQRVAALTVTGSYATRRLVQAVHLAAAPEGPDARKLVAGVLNGLTAYQMFMRATRPAPGEWVLVHGAGGGVGTMLLDLARREGVRAIGAASAGKRQAVEAKGGVHVDYTREDVVARTRDIAGDGVVAAYDHIGGSHLKRVSLASLRRGGAAVLYGAYDATKGGKARPGAFLDLMIHSSFNAFDLFGRSLGIIGYNVSYWRDSRPLAYRRDLEAVLGLIATGEIDPLIGAEFPLREAAKAHKTLEAAAVAGKVVLIP